MTECIYKSPIEGERGAQRYICRVSRIVTNCTEGSLCANRAITKDKQVVLKGGMYRYHGKNGKVVADVVVNSSGGLFKMVTRNGMRVVTVTYNDAKSIESLRNACNKALQVIKEAS